MDTDTLAIQTTAWDVAGAPLDCGLRFEQGGRRRGRRQESDRHSR